MEPNADEVARWVAAVERELAQIDAALAPLVERQAALIERLGLLKRLLASVGAIDAPPARTESHVGRVTLGRVYSSVRERVQAQAANILADAGRPLHINELHAEFIKRGFEVPGAGKPNNITVHLSDAADILSTSRGYYGVKVLLQADPAVRYPVADESRGRRAHG